MQLSEITKRTRKGPRTELTAPALRAQGHKEKPAQEPEKWPEKQEKNQEIVVSWKLSEDDSEK